MPRTPDENASNSPRASFRLKEKTPALVFGKRLANIRLIQDMQRDLGGTRHAGQKIRFLQQSYILHLVAALQVFCEELVSYGFRALEAREGTGTLHALAKAKVENAVARFNTPSRKNIDQLFKEALGIPNISERWTWDSVTAKQAGEMLDCVVKLRHEIAHSGTAKATLTYEKNFDYLKALFRIAQLAEDAVNERLGIH